MRAEFTLTSSLPIAKVFYYLASFHRVIEWDPSVVRATKVTSGKVQQGTRFDVDIRFMLATSRLQYQILQFEPPHLLLLEAKADQYRVTDRIRLETTENHTTRIEYQLEVHYASALQWMAPLLEPLVRRNLATALAALECTLNPQPRRLHHYPRWKDQSLVPGLLGFTRFGYQRHKRQWRGLCQDLTGKTIVITGASAGLGRAATLALADMGANIIAIVRNQKKAEQLQVDVRAHCDRNIRYLLADMTSLAQTRLVAETLLQENVPIDVLINNAGALFNQREETGEGFEKSLALLLLSPFLLTESLFPLLHRSSAGRVVNVVSGGLYTQAIHLDDLQYARESYHGAKAYARAKRGLLDMTRQWADQAENRGVAFHAMHPGWADTQGVRESLPHFHRMTQALLRDAAQGADTIVWLAAATEVQNASGKFWLDRTIHTSAIVPGTETSAENRLRLYVQLRELVAPYL